MTHNEEKKAQYNRAGFKGGKLGSCPEASATEELHKNSIKNYYLRKIKKKILKLIIWIKNSMLVIDFIYRS